MHCINIVKVDVIGDLGGTDSTCTSPQVCDMQEKLKTEAEGSARLRKQVAELTVAKAASEQIHMELQGMLSTLQQQRDVLQQEVAVLQGQLSQERSSRTQASDLQQELEGILYPFSFSKCVVRLTFVFLLDSAFRVDNLYSIIFGSSTTFYTKNLH
jgi:uncharacterized phage infection (PIP) family protein YhgE